jgi:hypothetical protein
MSNNTAESLLDIGLSPAEELVSGVASLLLLVFCMGMCIYNICRVTHKKQPFCLCCLIPVATSCCGLYPKPAPVDRQYAEDAYQGKEEDVYQDEEGTGARFLAPNFTGSYMNTLYPGMVMNYPDVDVNSHNPYRVFQEV